MADQRGRFAWYELMTTDVAAAGAFYRKTVGWSMKDESTPDMPYTVLRSDGAPLGGLMDIPEEGRKSGATPRWMAYVAVDDLDGTAVQIRRLGGTIFVPPTDTNIGRIAVVADPQNATFGLIKTPTYGRGKPGRLDAPGHVGWHELMAADRTVIFDFYSELFGWQKADAQTDSADLYQLFSAGGQTVGGVLTKVPSVAQPSWLHYFNVEDIGAATKQVNAGGGRILQGPLELPDGCWIARCVDPQGALFALQGARGPAGIEPASASEVGWSAKWGGIASQGRVVLPKPKR
ncbi:glyoxalase [Bradyrhizobium sp. LTSP849]|uniref:VOC family protein n=1 Tax=Bradyrhizobium sp. LTSP849 TaxID=1615890 RepID=UPI0005E15B95|nr:VOC family protein [Bradyrhizobium sp. LTSP849]KJC53710.1 glyoxalase [Bradyrhizobium sp. LTSP849]